MMSHGLAGERCVVGEHVRPGSSVLHSSCWPRSCSLSGQVLLEPPQAPHPGTPLRSTWQHRSTWRKELPIARPSSTPVPCASRSSARRCSAWNIRHRSTSRTVPTVNALDRRMPVPHYSVSKSGGWLTVRTASATLAIQAGLGTLHSPQHFASIVRRRPDSPPSPRAGNGNAPLGRSARPGRPRSVGMPPSVRPSPDTRARPGMRASSSIPEPASTWHVLGATAGPAVVSLRYYNLASPPLCANHQLS